MKKKEQPNIFQQLSPKRLIWPVLIGLAVVAFLFLRRFDREAFLAIDWEITAVYWILAAIGLMLVRDLAYMYRIRLLTGGQLSWRRSLEVILLWEFGSAATPSSIGGTALAIFLLSREKIKPGKSTAIVMSSIVLDESFFIIMVPLLLLFLGSVAIYPDPELVPHMVDDGLFSGLFIYFIVAFSLITIYTSIMAYGLFFNPLAIKRLLYRIFTFRFLRRWQKNAIKIGTDIIIASDEMKEKNLWFWMRAFMATAVSWSARFLVINCIFMILVLDINHIIVYSRQIFMWVIMSVSPTPGGSGLAELSFTAFLSDYFIAGLEAALSLLWRLITYYPYLFIGVILLPRWMKRVFGK